VAEDTGHLNVTFDHVWWADNVDERMPRVRFGKVHVLNSLFTASGSRICIAPGAFSNVRSENDVFIGVNTAVFLHNANSATVLQSIGDQGSTTNLNPPAFTPPYPYTPEPTRSVSASVMAGAGVK